MTAHPNHNDKGTSFKIKALMNMLGTYEYQDILLSRLKKKLMIDSPDELGQYFAIHFDECLLIMKGIIDGLYAEVIN